MTGTTKHFQFKFGEKVICNNISKKYVTIFQKKTLYLKNRYRYNTLRNALLIPMI